MFFPDLLATPEQLRQSQREPGQLLVRQQDVSDLRHFAKMYALECYRDAAEEFSSDPESFALLRYEHEGQIIEDYYFCRDWWPDKREIYERFESRRVEPWEIAWLRAALNLRLKLRVVKLYLTNPQHFGNRKLEAWKRYGEPYLAEHESVHDLLLDSLMRFELKHAEERQRSELLYLNETKSNLATYPDKYLDRILRTPRTSDKPRYSSTLAESISCLAGDGTGLMSSVAIEVANEIVSYL